MIVPVHDRADCIGRTLDTALAQTLESSEVIVVDDGSTDGVGRLLADRYPGVRVLRGERRAGVAAARNRGMAAARGDLLAFLDSDDLWSPDKLALQVADLDAHPRAVLSFTDTLLAPHGGDDRYSDHVPPRVGRYFTQLLEGGLIPTASAVVLRRRVLDEVGAFDEGMVTGSDRDLWLRCAARGPIRYVPLPLVRRVVRPDSLWASRDGWEAAAVHVVEKFLARPEGYAYRRYRRRLRAAAWFRLGAHHAFAEDWRTAGRWFVRAHATDPLIALRTRRGLVIGARLAAVAVARLARPCLGAKGLEAARRASGRIMACSPGSTPERAPPTGRPRYRRSACRPARSPSLWSPRVPDHVALASLVRGAAQPWVANRGIGSPRARRAPGARP